MKHHIKLSLHCCAAFALFSLASASAQTVAGTKLTIGTGCVASGSNSAAIGQNSTASGINSVAMGNATTASGGQSIAFQEGTASGDYSTALNGGTSEGRFSVSIGGFAIGEGSLALNGYAEGPWSFAVGSFTGPDGYYAAAFNGSQAFGANAFSANGGTAVGQSSMALGSGIANGIESVAMGTMTEAQGANETVIGILNILSSGTAASFPDYENANPNAALFTIGNGRYAANNVIRSNAFVVRRSGNAEIYGALDLSGPTAQIKVNGLPVLLSGQTSIYMPAQPANIGVGSSTASGTGAFAVGSSSSASFNSSAAIGSNVNSGEDGQVVVGKYNDTRANDNGVDHTAGVFIVASGSNSSTRTNAIRVTDSGVVLIKPSGDLSMGSFTNGEQP